MSLNLLKQGWLLSKEKMNYWIFSNFYRSSSCLTGVSNTSGDFWVESKLEMNSTTYLTFILSTGEGSTILRIKYLISSSKIEFRTEVEGYSYRNNEGRSIPYSCYSYLIRFPNII